MTQTRLLPKPLGKLEGVDSTPMPVTDYLVPDEKAAALQELNRIDTTSHHIRRWEFIYVVRDDAPAVHIRDMGPANLYLQGELQVVGAMEESVESLREHANDMRFQNSLARHMEERQGVKQQMKDNYFAWVFERAKLAQNQSTFGPGLTRQRNLFARRKS